MEARLKECWCDKCDDYRKPEPKRWESSKAIVIDHVCSVCGEVLLRIPRDITLKPPEPQREPRSRLMKVSEAIEVLSDSNTIKLPSPLPDFEDALRLGIEALKRLQLARRSGVISHTSPLIGETPEEET